MTQLFYMVNVWYLVVLIGFARSDCPNGWLHFEQSCYSFYQVDLDWNGAQSSCKAHNSMLAEIDTKTEADYLTAIANITNKAYDDFWLGGRDDDGNGKWKWSSTGRSFNYTAWGSSQPDNPGYQNCLNMNYYLKYKWNDAVCGFGNFFVCEKSYKDTGAIVG